MPKTFPEIEAHRFSARLVSLLEANGQRRHGAGAYLHRRYKVATVTANAWLNGTHMPEAETARQIAEDHGTTFEALYFGTESSVTKSSDAPASDPQYIRLPVMNVRAAAGDGEEAPSHLEVVRFLEVAREWAEQQFRSRLRHIEVLTARGRSMVGAGINDGDLLFVDTSVRQYGGDEGLYILSFRGGVQVKLLRPNHAANRLEIVSKPEGEKESVQIVEPEQEGNLHISGRLAAWWSLRKH